MKLNTYQLEQRKSKLLFHIEEQLGELEDGDWEDLSALDALIAESWETSALMIANKSYGEQIAKIKAAKEILDNAIKEIERVEERMKFQVHQHLVENGPIEIEIDGLTRYIKAGNTIKSIIDQEAVPIDKRKFILQINNELMEELIGNPGVLDAKRKNTILKDPEWNTYFENRSQKEGLQVIT